MKKFLYIFVPVIAITVGVVLFSKQGNNSGTDNSNDSTANQLFPVTQITHGHGLAVDIADSTKVYIATHHGLLMLKDDTDLYQVGKSKDDYMGFSPHPTDPKIFYSSGHPSVGGNIGFQMSEDGGLSWKKVSGGVNGPVDFHAMTVSPVNPNLIYGWYHGNVQRSQDGGKTWEIVNRGTLMVFLTADMKDENIVYAASPQGQGILVSKDKGSTWQQHSKDLAGGQVSTLAINPQNPQNMLSFSEKLGLAKSKDTGVIWEKINATFDGEILFIAFDKQDPKKVYALTHTNVLYKSLDSGETWDKIR